MKGKVVEPGLFVIFGGTGDLSRRKLLPALCRLTEEGRLPDKLEIVGVGRSPKTDEEFRAMARKAMAAHGFSAESVERLCRDRVHYATMGDGDAADYRAFGDRLAALRREHELPDNMVFYMSLPPGAFEPTVSGLGEAGLTKGAGYRRVVVEKPFGVDLQSARELNQLVHRWFDESQIYRIDHYLGKDTVQNLLVLRLANSIIESSWNRTRIECVQITVGETLGVGSRAEYYDRAGALRDMVQNHLTQLLTLVAMEVPTRFDAESVRYEKIKVLRSIAPIRCADVVRGQYAAGELDGKAVPGYHQEDGVKEGSTTETFVALQVFVDTWRWQGVPFYLRTGKRMPAKTTQIALRFRDVPVSLFKSMGCSQDTADVLIITIQPHEGFSLHIDIKVPGDGFRLDRIPLSFHYGDRFGSMPEAYRTLLLDVLAGDQTLFVHADEVEESWRVYTPLVENPPRVVPYAAGTWGPEEADRLAIPERDLWQVGSES